MADVVGVVLRPLGANSGAVVAAPGPGIASAAARLSDKRLVIASVCWRTGKQCPSRVSQHPVANHSAGTHTVSGGWRLDLRSLFSTTAAIWVWNRCSYRFLRKDNVNALTSESGGGSWWVTAGKVVVGEWYDGRREKYSGKLQEERKESGKHDWGDERVLGKRETKGLGKLLPRFCLV